MELAICRCSMRRYPVILAAFITLAAASGSVRGANEPVKKLVTEWNREGLFDSTTTRAELLEMGRSAVDLKH